MRDAGECAHKHVHTPLSSSSKKKTLQLKLEFMFLRCKLFFFSLFLSYKVTCIFK